MEQSYKEKYEQAIERLKQWDREHPCAGYVLSDRDKFIFPELKESWDEKMRKAIKEALSSKQAEDIIESKYKIKMVDVSDWLEKQGQVKESHISQHENRTCEENGNSLTSEDAIEREVKEDAGGYPYIDATELYDYDNDKPLAKAGDRVKVVFIKDK